MAITPGGLQAVVSDTMTRPADTNAYAAGDLVANSTTAGSVTGFVFQNAIRFSTPAENFRIERCRLRKSGATLTNASFRLYICAAMPTLSVGDNGVFNSSSVLAVDDVQNVIGWFDIAMDRAGTAGARGSGTPNVGSAITIRPTTGTTLIGLLEATAAYSPGNAETFTATLEGQWS